MPLDSSRAFGVGVQTSTSAGVRPPPVHWAEAPAGARSAIDTRAASAANPALNLELFVSKPISFVCLRG